MLFGDSEVVLLVDKAIINVVNTTMTTANDDDILFSEMSSVRCRTKEQSKDTMSTAAFFSAISQVSGFVGNVSKSLINCDTSASIEKQKFRKEKYMMSMVVKLHHMRQEYMQLVLLIYKNNKDIKVREMETHELKPTRKDPFTYQTEEFAIPVKLKYNESKGVYKYKKMIMQVMEKNSLSQTLYPVGPSFSQNLANCVSEDKYFFEFVNDQYHWKSEKDKKANIIIAFFTRRDRVKKQWIYYTISKPDEVLNCDWTEELTEEVDQKSAKKRNIKRMKQIIKEYDWSPDATPTTVPQTPRRHFRHKSNLLVPEDSKLKMIMQEEISV
jgi:hypothetical protein